jgi:uncharacterized cupredoxin-like copper-binding protein
MSSHALRNTFAGSALALAALGACGGGGADRAVALQSHDYAYSGLETFQGKAGEKVEFAMSNAGPADHEFEVFGPDGEDLGEIGPTSAGKVGTVTLSLKKPGTYRFRCGVSDHESRGMTGTFLVT